MKTSTGNPSTLNDSGSGWRALFWICIILALPTGFTSLIPAFIFAALADAARSRDNNTRLIIEAMNRRPVTDENASDEVSKPISLEKQPNPPFSPPERRALTILIPALILFVLLFAAAFLFFPR